PPLPVGRYLVQLLSDKQIEETINYSFFDVSDLTIFTENEENKITFTLLDRITGEPIKRKKIYVKNGEQGNGNEAITRKSSTLLKTNKLGEVSMRVSEKERNYNRYYSILAVNKKDSLLSSFANYNYRGYDNENSEPEMTVKPFIYLDRAIYRPGQTVYFKAVLAADLKGKSEIVPNYNLHVYVEDVNGQQIFETDLKTNDWGSINGSFTLPKDGLTGSFTIYVEDNEKADNKFSNALNWDEGQLPFQVEEYKRPRFKAELDAVTKTFKVNDSVTVTGKAQALLGSAITGATVKYTVNRTVTYSRWRYGYINTTDKIITEGTTKTDNKGAYSIDFLAEPDDAINPDFKPVFNYEINVEITDVNGETRTASRSVRVGYHTLELQLIAGGILDLESNEIKVQTRNLNGENVPAQVKIEVKKQEQINKVVIPQVLPATEFYTMSDAAYKNLYPYAPERKPLENDWKTAT
ncbi:MAG: MG2 domain-containing protein, partial [Nonlabens sp.]|nr:MG2 domain-containing protein [Nonlabens sp.]